MAESERLMAQVSRFLVSEVNPGARARIASRVRASVQKEIADQYGHVLALAPTVHFLPLHPQPKKEQSVRKLATEALEWLKKQPGIFAASLYELSDRDQPKRSRQKADANVLPAYMIVLICSDKDVMVRLRQSDEGYRMQQELREMCEGISATDQGEFGINTMLLGL